MDQDTKDAYIKSLLEEKAQRDADYEAIKQEFQKNITKDYSSEDIKERVRVLLADAFATLKELMLHADKETVRFAAAKYVMDIGIGQVKVTGENDPDKELVELLRDLKKDDSGSTEKTNLPKQ